MKSLIVLLLLVPLLANVPAVRPMSPQAVQQPPNVLMICVDDMNNFIGGHIPTAMSKCPTTTRPNGPSTA